MCICFSISGLWLSLPAALLNMQLRKGEFRNDSTLQPYETLEPFNRFGVYAQELYSHREIWWTSEVSAFTAVHMWIVVYGARFLVYVFLLHAVLGCSTALSSHAIIPSSITILTSVSCSLFCVLSSTPSLLLL